MAKKDQYSKHKRREVRTILRENINRVNINDFKDDLTKDKFVQAEESNEGVHTQNS